MDENKTKRVFRSLDELKEYLQEHPEMNGVSMQIDFEKSETSEDQITDAMHEEIETIKEEVAAIMKRHPNVKMYHLDFQYGDKNEEEEGEDGVKPPFPYDKYFSTEKDEAYNYKEFREHFWKEVRNHGGLPNALKTVDYLSYDRVKGEIENFKKVFGALLHDMANKIKEM